MLGIGSKLPDPDNFHDKEAENLTTAGGVSESPLHPVSFTISKMLASRTAVTPVLSADLNAAKRRVPLAAKHVSMDQDHPRHEGGSVITVRMHDNLAAREHSVEMREEGLTNDESKGSGGGDRGQIVKVNKPRHVAALDQDGETERIRGRCEGLEQHILQLQTKASMRKSKISMLGNRDASLGLCDFPFLIFVSASMHYTLFL